MYIGKNIGYEQYGKGVEFLRPVIVLKKLSKYLFFGVPLTSKEKKGEYYYKLIFKNKTNYALINQVKIFDIRRNKYRAGRLSNDTFHQLRKRIITILTPIRENDP